MFLFDPLYLLFALPALLLGLYAQFRVQRAYRRYADIANSHGLTGMQVARRLLSANGLSHISIEQAPGILSDHYDPAAKTLRLSDGVARESSIAALAVAAHEVGHALQDRDGYAPLRWRAALVPAVNLGSWLGPILFLAGFLLQATGLAWFGMWLFAATAVFALVTLPVEMNASRRALALVRGSYVAGSAELAGIKAVLDAAALTYVAALAQSVSTLLYYAFVLTGLRTGDSAWE